MKLHEFLSQFEGLDPNMEVYGYTHSDKVCLEKKKKFHEIVFINEGYPKYKNNHQSDFSNREVLVIS